MLLVPYVDFAAQFRVTRESTLASLSSVLESGQYILGKTVDKFEQAFAKQVGSAYAISVANGTDALILSMKALGIGPNDEVITVANSWISTVSAIVHVGAKPVFVDVGDDFHIDPDKIEACITKKTKAILPVHLTGQSCDLKRLEYLADKHQLAFIEDAAQAFKSKRDNISAGSCGTVGCFSLHPLKNLNAVGDGGVITTQDKGIADRLRLLRNHGLISRDEVSLWGYNSRLDALQAAILLERMPHVDDWISRRREIAKYYSKRLSNVVVCPKEEVNEFHTYHLYMIQCENRDALQNCLAKKGIESKIHYPIPTHLQEAAVSLGYKPGSLPKTEHQAKHILSLPVHPFLNKDQIEWVASSIQDFYR